MDDDYSNKFDPEWNEGAREIAKQFEESTINPRDKGPLRHYTLDEISRLVHTKANEAGVNPQGGKKWDQGKPRPSLLPVGALQAILPVLEHGASKYGDRNWTLVEKERYVEALGRHFLQWLQGVQSGDILVTDDDSGLSHLSHLTVNALFLLELAND